MKKLIIHFCLGLTLLGLFMGVSDSVVFAQEQQMNQLPLNDGNYDTALRNNIVNKIINDGVSLSNKKKTAGMQDIIRALFTRKYMDANGVMREGLLNKINVVVGSVAIAMFIFIAVKFVFANGNEESMSKTRTSIAWLILGLAIVSIAEFIAYWILDPMGELSNTSLTNGEAGDLLYGKFLQVKVFVQIMIAGIMLVLLGISGIKLVMSDGEEEKINNEKRFLKTFMVGGFLILLAEVITKIISNPSPEKATTKGIWEVIGFLNYALSFVAVATTLMLILSSVYYVSCLGNEESMTRAKKIIMGCIVGLVASISSYAIVTFVIRGV